MPILDCSPFPLGLLFIVDMDSHFLTNIPLSMMLPFPHLLMSWQQQRTVSWWFVSLDFLQVTLTLHQVDWDRKDLNKFLSNRNKKLFCLTHFAIKSYQSINQSITFFKSLNLLAFHKCTTNSERLINQSLNLSMNQSTNQSIN